MDSIHCQEVSVIAVSSIGGFAATVQLEVFEEGGREFLIKLGFWKLGLMVMAIETTCPKRCSGFLANAARGPVCAPSYVESE